MSVRQVYAAHSGYVVTPEGHEDLVHADVCYCRPKLVGLLIECPDCGTVYGYTRDSSMASSPYQRKDG